MPKITIASLERRILVLESEKQTLGGQLSINGEFQLEAFKLLLELAKQEPDAYETYKGYLLHSYDPRVMEHSDPTPLFSNDALCKILNQ